jgi:hypothetical protein
MMVFYYSIMVSFNRIFNLLLSTAFIVVKDIPHERGAYPNLPLGRIREQKHVLSVALNFPLATISLAWIA